PNLAVGEGRQLADDLAPTVAGKVHLTLPHLPMAAEDPEPLEPARQGRGLLETFPKDHLAVKPAVDLMVDVLDTRTGEEAGDRACRLVRPHLNKGFRGRVGFLRPGARGRPCEQTQSGDRESCVHVDSLQVESTAGPRRTGN